MCGPEHQRHRGIDMFRFFLTNLFWRLDLPPRIVLSIMGSYEEEAFGEGFMDSRPRSCPRQARCSHGGKMDYG